MAVEQRARRLVEDRAAAAHVRPLEHAAALRAAGRTAMVQPYLPAVDVTGETALLHFGGAFSHAVQKGPLLLPGEVDTPFWHRAGMDTTKLGLGEKAAPTKVAQEGYEAMKAGKDRVVAGKPGSKFIGRVLNNILPDTAKAAAHSGGAEPGSGLK